jgi:hypothetical protein
MNKEERDQLAVAYANAWYAVKGTAVQLTAGPRGWFTIRYESGGMARGVKASVLLEGLVTLTSRLVNNDLSAHRRAQIERERDQQRGFTYA